MIRVPMPHGQSIHVDPDYQKKLADAYQRMFGIQSIPVAASDEQRLRMDLFRFGMTLQPGTTAEIRAGDRGYTVRRDQLGNIHITEGAEPEPVNEKEAELERLRAGVAKVMGW